MPLVKCIDCGRMISDRAKNCIFCGCPLEETLKEINAKKDIETIGKNSTVIERVQSKSVSSISCIDTRKINVVNNDKRKEFKDTGNTVKETVRRFLSHNNKYVNYDCPPDNDWEEYRDDEADFKEFYREGMECLHETGWFYPDETEGEEEDEEWIRLYGSNIRISNYWKK